MVFGSAASGDSVSFGIRAVADLKGVDATAKALTDLGKKGETAGKGIDKGMDEAAKSLDKTRISAAALGAAIGTTVGIVSKLGQAHKSEESQIRAVERAYGDQAETINRLASELQNMGIASDDAVRISALGAQSLAKNYGLTADEITQLIERSADLAAVTFDQYGNQLQLADVMQRVSGAIRGEGEAAEVLGLAMSDSALASRAAADGLTGWTTSMTESEKAAFRFKVLMEDSASAQGAAAERAEGLAGRLQALKLQVQDAAAEFGGFLGPVGESTAVLGDFALAMPLIGAGAGKAVTSLRGLREAATLSTLGTGALSLAMGPAGLVAAAGLAAGAIFYLSQRESDNALTARELEAANVSLLDSFVELAGAIQRAGALNQSQANVTFVQQLIENGSIAQRRLEEISQLMLDLRLQAQSAEGDVFFTGQLGDLDAYIASLLEANGAMADGVVTMAELEQVQAQLAQGFALSGDEAEALSGSMEALLKLVANPELYGAEIAADVDRILEAMARKDITVDQALDQLNAIITDTSGYSVVLRENTGDIEANTKAINDSINAMLGWAGRGRQMAQDAAEIAHSFAGWMESLEGTKGHTLVLGEVADVLARVTEAEIAHFQAVSASSGAVEDATDTAALYVAQTDELATKQREAAEAFAALYESVTGRNLTLDALVASSATFADNLGLGFAGAASALDTVQRIALGNLDAVRSTTDSIVDQVEQIVNLEGTYESINVALNRGLISQERWASYGRAFVRMQRDRVKLEEDLAVIQANQIPILEEALNTQTAWADQVKDLKGADLAAALGFADAETAGKALEIQAYAIAAAQGELGTQGVATAEALIAGAIQANPYLQAVLETMGVITTLPDGTWRLNTSGLEEAETGTDRLTRAINDLVGAYELILNVDLNDDGVLGRVEELDGKEIAASLNVKMSGSLGSGGKQSLADLAGDSLDNLFGSADVEIGADTTAADEVMDALKVRVEDIDGLKPDVTLDADPLDFNFKADRVEDRIDEIDRMIATASIDANTFSFWNKIANIPSTVGTRYIDVVYRTLGGNGTPSAAGAAVLGDSRPQTVLQQSYNLRSASTAASGPITVTANFGDINEASDIPRVEAAILTTLERAADRVYAATVAGG